MQFLKYKIFYICFIILFAAIPVYANVLDTIITIDDNSDINDILSDYIDKDTLDINIDYGGIIFNKSQPPKINNKLLINHHAYLEFKKDTLISRVFISDNSRLILNISESTNTLQQMSLSNKSLLSVHGMGAESSSITINNINLEYQSSGSIDNSIENNNDDYYYSLTFDNVNVNIIRFNNDIQGFVNNHGLINLYNSNLIINSRLDSNITIHNVGLSEISSVNVDYMNLVLANQSQLTFSSSGSSGGGYNIAELDGYAVIKHDDVSGQTFDINFNTYDTSNSKAADLYLSFNSSGLDLKLRNKSAIESHKINVYIYNTDNSYSINNVSYNITPVILYHKGNSIELNGTYTNLGVSVNMLGEIKNTVINSVDVSDTLYIVPNIGVEIEQVLFNNQDNDVLVISEDKLQEFFNPTDIVASDFINFTTNGDDDKEYSFQMNNYSQASLVLNSKENYAGDLFRAIYDEVYSPWGDNNEFKQKVAQDFGLRSSISSILDGLKKEAPINNFALLKINDIILEDITENNLTLYHASDKHKLGIDISTFNISATLDADEVGTFSNIDLNSNQVGVSVQYTQGLDILHEIGYVIKLNSVLSDVSFDNDEISGSGNLYTFNLVTDIYFKVPVNINLDFTMSTGNYDISSDGYSTTIDTTNYIFLIGISSYWNYNSYMVFSPYFNTSFFIQNIKDYNYQNSRYISSVDGFNETYNKYTIGIEWSTEGASEVYKSVFLKPYIKLAFIHNIYPTSLNTKFLVGKTYGRFNTTAGGSSEYMLEGSVNIQYNNFVLSPKVKYTIDNSIGNVLAFGITGGLNI